MKQLMVEGYDPDTGKVICVWWDEDEEKHTLLIDESMLELTDSN